MGLLAPKHGVVKVDGEGIRLANRQNWLSNLGYISQTPYFIDGDVSANIAFGIEKAQQDPVRIVEAAVAAGAHDFILNDLQGGYASHVGQNGTRLSGGQRQRLAVARAIYAERQVLLLDEMTSALDDASERVVLDSLELLRGRKTIILVTHRPEPLQICDEVFHIADNVMTRKVTVPGAHHPPPGQK